MIFLGFPKFCSLFVHFLFKIFLANFRVTFGIYSPTRRKEVRMDELKEIRKRHARKVDLDHALDDISFLIDRVIKLQSTLEAVALVVNGALPKQVDVKPRVPKDNPKKEDENRSTPGFLNVPEAAMYLKLATGTIYQLIHKKHESKIPVHYLGRRPVFLADELKQWVLAQKAE